MLLCRWGSNIHCVESIMKNKSGLQLLAIDDSIKSLIGQNVKKLLLSEVFWNRCEGYLLLMKPFADAITAVEGDNVDLSAVLSIFTKLQDTLKENVSKSPLLKAEEDSMLELVNKRRAFLVKKVHLAADLLNPKSIGSNLTDDEQVML